MVIAAPWNCWRKKKKYLLVFALWWPYREQSSIKVFTVLGIKDQSNAICLLWLSFIYAFLFGGVFKMCKLACQSMLVWFNHVKAVFWRHTFWNWKQQMFSFRLLFIIHPQTVIHPKMSARVLQLCKSHMASRLLTYLHYKVMSMKYNTLINLN